MTTRWLDAKELVERLDEFVALLTDAVTQGASIGFMLPLPSGEAAGYWRKVAADVASGGKSLVGIFDEAGRLVGSAQLAWETRPNGNHRAEVQKVMVRSERRGGGAGSTLMRAVEARARAAGRTLLFLDTSVGAAGATKFYERLGYTFAGGIPDYARDPDGTLSANAIFYKRLS